MCGVGWFFFVCGVVFLVFAVFLCVVVLVVCVWFGCFVVFLGDRCDSLMSMFRASVDEWRRYTLDCPNSNEQPEFKEAW